MAKRQILAGVADQTVDLFIQDSSSTTGAGLTGLVYNTASLTCYYRKGATGTPAALSLATQTVGGAHSDGGFVAVDGTNCPGQYRLDLSDTIVATAGMVTVHLKGAANMVPCVLEIEVVDFSHTGQSAIDLKDFADAGYDPSTNKVQGVVLVDTATTLTNLPAITSNWLTAAGVDSGVWSELFASTLPAGNPGEFGNTVTAAAAYAVLAATDTAAILTDTGTTLQAELDYIQATVDSILTDTAEIGTAGAGLTNINLPNQTMDIVGNITGNLSGSVGSVTGAVGSVTAGVTVSTNNDKTGYTLSSAGQQALIETCFTFDATANYAGAAAGSLVKEIADNAGGSSLTASDIADEIETRVLNAGRTIKRIAPGGGGDYTSLSAAITALASTAGIIELVCSAGNIGGGNLHSLTSASEVILRSDMLSRHRHDTAQPLSETAYFASNIVFSPTGSGPAKLRIEGLRSSGVSIGIPITVTAPSTTYDVEIIDNLFNNSGGVGSTLDQLQVIVQDGTLNILVVCNTHFFTTTGSAKGYQVYVASTADGADAARINVRAYGNTGNTDVASRVVDGIGIGAETPGGGTAVVFADVRNNLMLGVEGSGTAGAISVVDTGGTTTLTGSHNATNDSSASDNGLTSGLTSVVAADVLSSPTTSNIQLSTAATRDAGYPLSQEIMGRRVKSGSVWDVGSHEFQAGLSAAQLGYVNTSLSTLATSNALASLVSTVGAAGAGLTAVVLGSTGLNAVLVDGKTLPAALQYIAAGVAGKVSGAGTSTEVFVGLDGSTTRLTVTADASGNRTAVTYG